MTTNIFIIAAIIFFEARGEPLEGKYAVLSCIQNGTPIHCFAPWSRKGVRELDVMKEIREAQEFGSWVECLTIAMEKEEVPRYPFTHFYNPTYAVNPMKLYRTRKISKHLFGVVNENT